MRSNDLIWGVPYDVFVFTFLQELAAMELQVGLGTYHHFAGSLHIYDRHFNLVDEILSNNDDYALDITPMPELPDSSSGLRTFLKSEQLIRSNLISYSELEKIDLHPYWKALLETLIERYYKSLPL
jgi:thymidylate synthase